MPSSGLFIALQCFTFSSALGLFSGILLELLKVWSASVLGPLCAGVVGKKKKKMMYLTTKNAGKFTWAWGKMIPYLVIFVLSFVVSVWLIITFYLEFDRHELRIYEEVAKVPPFRRKTLVLIGAQGVGRRSLKNKLLVSDPQRYGTTIPCE